MSSRQFSFLTGPNKLDFVRVYAGAFTSLVGPPYITLWRRFYFFEFSFSTLPRRDFSLFSIFFFLFSFLRSYKKHKNANKRISYFFPLRCFLSAFFIFVRLFAFLCFCLVAFLCFFVRLVFFGAFCAFWCMQNLFVKKNNKEFKTVLVTSFILLLNSSHCRH